jgi:uncharacterized protein YbjT (DUF2867 family)
VTNWLAARALCEAFDRAAGDRVIICAMRILVTGASGSVGSLLVPRLLADGHHVCALGRDPARVQQALSRQGTRAVRGEIDVVRGDALSGEGLSRAMEGVDVAYYLIHSMERASLTSPPLLAREQLAAHTFATAAVRAELRRIVFLGGLLPRAGAEPRKEGVRTDSPSPHLASREAVELTLLEAVPDSIALRASIVVGARSRSFRLLVHLVERMPVLPLPAWRRFRTQPIDARDVTELLAAAASATIAQRSLDVGGPDVLSYGQMISRIAELMLVRRPSLGLRVSVTPLTARIAAAIAGEDPALVLPLMESLQGDLLPADDRAAELLNVNLHSFDSAVENALGEWEQSEPLAAR